MKILIVSYSDIEGGAARATYRLHRALLAAGVNSHMLVQFKAGDDFTVTGPIGKYQKAMAAFRSSVEYMPTRFYKARTQTTFSSSLLPLSGIAERINTYKADVVHLHWVSRGMIGINEISKIKAPIVWSLHDMWAFTGGCHYNEDCGSFQAACGNCKVLGSNKSYDLSRKVFNAKTRAYSKINSLTAIGLSKWISDCAEKSSLLRSRRVINLPNPLDTNSFSPIDKQQSRDLYELPRNKKLVLFGAVGSTSDPRKGFTKLAEALNILKGDDIELLIFGGSAPKDSGGFEYKAHYLGHIHDELSLRILYSAADVMVVPSLQENLSNAILESLSCGTPVVAFNIGGNSDMIEHKINGYLAKALDSADLAHGINWVISNPEYSMLAKKAREKAVGSFDVNVVVPQYINLYRELTAKISNADGLSDSVSNQ